MNKEDEFRIAVELAKGLDSTAQRLEEAYIRYLVLANAGGIAASLGIADALVSRRGGAAISLSSLAGPMWLFLAGIISGGLVVALLARRARHESDMQNQRLLQLTREVGYDVPDLPPLFNWIERKGLSYLTQAINFLGIISQFCFAIGAVWGLMWI